MSDNSCPNCEKLIDDTYLNRVFNDAMYDLQDGDRFETECPFCERALEISITSTPVFAVRHQP